MFIKAMQQVIDRLIILCAVIVSITLVAMYLSFLYVHLHNVAQFLIDSIALAITFAS